MAAAPSAAVPSTAEPSVTSAAAPSAAAAPSTMTPSLENEGFLYINTEMTGGTFKNGEIIDMEHKVVCPGEIVPIVLDMDSETEYAASVSHYAAKIQYQTPLLHGLQVRFYWVKNADGFCILHMSTVDEIYPNQLKEIIPPHILAQMDITQMDQTKVYYATIEPPPYSKLILTYITDIQDPQLSSDRHLVLNDKAFQHHQLFYPVIKHHADAAADAITTANPAHLYGTRFLCEDGQVLDRYSPLYIVMRSMAKPSKMSFREYFQKALNTYAVGNTTATYLEDLFCDIKTFIQYFPEHETEAVNLMAEYTISYTVSIRE